MIKLPSFPKLVLVATCSPCNAKCPHCPCTVVPSIRKTEELYISPKRYKKIVDECSRHDAHIRMSGYGEPFMHPNIFLLLELAVDKTDKVSIITNGSLLDTKKIKHLIDLGLESIEISVDSHRRDIYESIRVGLDFDVVHKNIVDLIDERDRRKSNTNIMVSIINQPSRNPDIDGAVKYWNQIVDMVFVRKYVTWGVLPTDDCGDKPFVRDACPYPWERLMVDPSGYIRLCPYDDQKLIDPFGRVGKDRIEYVWLGERMGRIRRRHDLGRFEEIELCTECCDWAYRSWTHNYRGAIDGLQNKKA